MKSKLTYSYYLQFAKFRCFLHWCDCKIANCVSQIAILYYMAPQKFGPSNGLARCLLCTVLLTKKRESNKSRARETFSRQQSDNSLSFHCNHKGHEAPVVHYTALGLSIEFQCMGAENQPSCYQELLYGPKGDWCLV